MPMKAELLSIGTELLLGQIVDTNANYLAGRLALLGIDCLHMQTVGDNLVRAKQAIERALGRSDLVVATGGLGPTEDDLTREAIAAALGETPSVDPALEADLVAWFSGRGLVMPDRNRKQAWLIPSARALPNPNGTAPGWDVQKDGKRIIAMPGVPREMTPMWESVEPSLTRGGALRWRHRASPCGGTRRRAVVRRRDRASAGRSRNPRARWARTWRRRPAGNAIRWRDEPAPRD